MSFTFEQCKKLKEWGYPQVGEEYFYRKQQIGVVGGRSYSGEEVVPDVAIPTIEGVIQWLAEIGVVISDKAPKEARANIELRYEPDFDDEAWWGIIEAGNDFVDVRGSSAIEALYNLAAKVKGEM